MYLKKWMLSMICCLLFFNLSFMVAQAEEPKNTISYNYNSTTKTLTISGEGEMPDYEIDSYGECTAPWEQYLDNMENLVIEDGITKIGEYAFYDWFMSPVKKVTLGKDVQTIDSMAFGMCANIEEVHISSIEQWCKIDMGCTPFMYRIDEEEYSYLYVDGKKVTDVVIPDGITEIKYNAFYGISGIKTVKIPSSVTSIELGAFANVKGIETIEIPDSVTSVGNRVFEGSTLKTIEIPDSVTEIGGYKLFAGCENLIHVILPNGLTEIGEGMFRSCHQLQELQIPNTVIEIGEDAFAFCASLENLVIPNNVAEIGSSAFYKCSSFQNIEIPNSVINIGGYAFGGCTNLESVHLSENLTSINSKLFMNCSNLKQIIIPSGTISIESYAFAGAGLTSIELPDTVTNVGEYAFQGATSLEKAILSDAIKELSASVFSGCSALNEVSLPANLTALGNAVFADCTGLEAITLPATVESIGDDCFYNCIKLKEIELPEKINSINKNTFEGCLGIEEITIPKDVSSLGAAAFKNCNNLILINFMGNAPTIAADAFGGVTATCYYIPNETWTNETLTADFGGDLIWTYEGEEVPDDINKCGVSATWELLDEGTLVVKGTGAMYDYSVADLTYAPWYEGRTSIKAVKIENGITHIGDGAFYNCSNVTNLELADSIETIGDKAFEKCTGITELNLPDKVKSIGEYAFSGVNVITLEFPDEVTNVGKAAFRSCVRLINVTMPDSLTYISEAMFEWCTSLQNVSFSKALTSIENFAFQYCTDMRSIELPEGLISIGNSAFAYCGHTDYGGTGLYFKSVTLPSTIKSIGSNAFIMCIYLEKINLPYGLETIGNGAFSWCSKLASIEIPGSVRVINDSVFSQCKALKTVTFKGDAPSFHRYSFTVVTATCYYSNKNTTWTSAVKQNYDGKLTWVAIEMIEDGSGGGSGDSAGDDEGDDSGTTGGDTGNSGDDGGNTGTSGGTTGGNTGSGENPGGNNGNESGSGGDGTGSGDSGAGEGTDTTLRITSQPKDHIGQVNDNVTFTVEANGEGLKYEWFYSKDGGKTFEKTWTSGYNTNTLTPILRWNRDEQQFYCVITDENGKSVQSDTVKMSVETSDVVITTQPVSVESGCQGTLYHFNVEAEGTNIEYRWYYSSDKGETWQESWIDGFNTNTLNIRMNPNRSGWLFRCAVTSGLKNTVVSDEVLFQLQESSVELTGNPENVVAAAGETASFSVTATGNDLTYRWYVSTDKSEWTQTWLNGYDTATLEFPSIAGRAGKYYKCVVMDGSGTVATSRAAAFVLTLPEITGQPKEQTLAVGETATFTVEAEGTGLSYLWYASTDGGASWNQTWLEGYNTDTLSFNVTTGRAGKLYKCVVTDMAGNTVESNAVLLELMH